MTLRPYKFVVKAVPQILDADGEVVGEEQGVQPVELIGVKQLVAWANEFPARLAESDPARQPDPAPQPRTRKK